jgi:hypothetical protein
MKRHHRRRRQWRVESETASENVIVKAKMVAKIFIESVIGVCGVSAAAKAANGILALWRGGVAKMARKTRIIEAWLISSMKAKRRISKAGVKHIKAMGSVKSENIRQ